VIRRIRRRPGARRFVGVSINTDHRFFCLACGTTLAKSLALAGSPRCHDCRDVDAPLRADLFARQKLVLAQQAPLADAA
jgi:hypothetical protein